MTDREMLLTALVAESERRAGAEVSVLDVIAMLERMGAEHQLVVHHRLVDDQRGGVCQLGAGARARQADAVGASSASK